MNIVIPYRYVETPELKYSLRSIQKYLTGYDRVFIVGDYIPKWLKNIEFIYCSEESVKCAKNILKKLIAAKPIAGETFLKWDDDLFLQQPLEVKDIKYWYCGTLEQALDKAFGRYNKIILNTALRNTGFERFYDIHAPMIMEWWCLGGLENWWADKDLLVKSTYCHYYHLYSEKKLNEEEMEDCKINIPQSKEKILETIKGKMFFSINSYFDPVIEEVLNELYPEKSKYEK